MTVTTVHIYRAPAQPATRFVTDLSCQTACRRTAPTWLRVRWVTRRPVPRFAPGRLPPASCCARRRPARNLTVQVYYDAAPFSCRAGTGCKVPKRRMPPGRVLLREFAWGRSAVGLARKYGRTSAEIQAAIRRANNRMRARS